MRCHNCSHHPMLVEHNALSCPNCGQVELSDPVNNSMMDAVVDQAEIALGMLCEDKRAPEEFEELKKLCAEDKFSNMEELMQSLVPIIFMAGVRKGHT